MSENRKLLHELWPEPDWASLIESGLPKATAALLYMLYQGFAVSVLPKGSLNLSEEDLISTYKASVEHMRELFASVPEEVHQEVSRGHMDRALGALANAYHTLTGVPRDPKASSQVQQLKFFSLGRFGGRTVRSPFFLNTKGKQLVKALPDLGWPSDLRAVKTGICHWVVPSTNAWGVAQFSNAGMKALAKPVMNRETAAREAMRLIGEHMARQQNERQAIPRRTNALVSEPQRSGPPTSRGESVPSEEQLNTRFRLTSVAFTGKAGQGEQAQHWRNTIYDALDDLSFATGLPPGWVGLSRLSIAIGSRRGASASSLRTLHLAQPGRASTLAYEWCLCLDHHLAQYTFQLDTSKLPKASQHGVRLSGLRSHPGKRDIAFAVIRLLNYMATGSTGAIEDGQRSDFRKAAQKIANLAGAGKDWADPSTMLCRAFESYVQDKLSAQGISNPLLAVGTRAEDLADGAAADPYPQGTERRAMAKLFDDLFLAIGQASKHTHPTNST